jgi:hypothetical protein
MVGQRLLRKLVPPYELCQAGSLPHGISRGFGGC